MSFVRGGQYGFTRFRCAPTESGSAPLASDAELTGNTRIAAACEDRTLSQHMLLQPAESAVWGGTATMHAPHSAGDRGIHVALRLLPASCANDVVQ